MIVIPAIDIKESKCVRLAQGRFDQVTTYAEDPLEAAYRWQEEGAERIHVVDLDGSREGRPCNADIVLRIVRNIKIPVQVGGGIRDMDTIAFYLENGAESVILGTALLQNEKLVRQASEKFHRRIILGIDAIKGMVAVKGWTLTTEKSAIELAKSYERDPVKAIVYTDIERDGMQSGLNLEAIRSMVNTVHVPIIASGGVASLRDIDNLLALGSRDIYGVIIGRALYTGELSLKEAVTKTKKSTRS